MFTVIIIYKTDKLENVLNICNSKYSIVAVSIAHNSDKRWVIQTLWYRWRPDPVVPVDEEQSTPKFPLFEMAYPACSQTSHFASNSVGEHAQNLHTLGLIVDGDAQN